MCTSDDCCSVLNERFYVRFLFHFYSYLPLNVTQLCVAAVETYRCYSLLTVVCFAMAGTTSPKFCVVAEIFKSMEYGPVSNSSSIAKVCILYTSVVIHVLFL